MGKSQKNYLSIKSKLMAAVAMLLVASFMVVSSTYAWFTLSTAPEVTGIKTTVGANGSLEIALLSSDGTEDIATVLTEIDDAIGLTDLIEKNVTWGNLVDLSDIRYGLEKLSLLPSRLNAVAGVDANNEPIYTLAAMPLMTPEYGADGRVSAITANTVTGIYKDSVFAASNATGVRAIGTASGMTTQQLGLRSALATYSTQLGIARTKAGSSMNSCGTELASIAATHQFAGGTDDNDYDITNVGTMLTALTEANDAIGNAIKAFFSAAVAIEYNDEEAEYIGAKATVDGATVESLMTTYGSLVAAYPSVTSAYNLYTSNKTVLSEATTKFNAVATNEAGKKMAKWDKVNDILGGGLLDVSKLKINGYELSAAKEQMVNILLEGIQVQLPADSGVHANIAQVTSNYETSIQLQISAEVSPTGSAVNAPARMITIIGSSEFIVIMNTSAMNGLADPTSSDTGNKNITDYYGYVLDFAFRTNATGSDLMLQTTPVNRIYTDGGSAETLGNGSTMTFASADPSFTNEDVENLMREIRLVFVDTQTKEIVAIGAMDQEADATLENGSDVKANIYLYNYTITESGVLTLGTKVADSEGKTKLMGLEKNAATALSVYVYLDGDRVDNSKVANAQASMTGKLNLQFSSSADLVPMEYTPLKQPTDASSTTTTSATAAETTTPTGN